MGFGVSQSEERLDGAGEGWGRGGRGPGRGGAGRGGEVDTVGLRLDSDSWKTRKGYEKLCRRFVVEAPIFYLLGWQDKCGAGFCDSFF